MEGGKFFSVPYGNRNEMKMLMLREMGGYAMYGRWVALLGMLYERKGLIDMNDALMRKIVCMELDYYKAKSEAGKKGMAKRWAKKGDN